MIRYQVEITPLALAEIDETLAFLSAHSRPMAIRWYQRLRTAIESLIHNPDRCPPAPENEWYEGFLRQLLHGKRPHVYRILFEVQGNVVRILRVRHARQDLLESDDW